MKIRRSETQKLVRINDGSFSLRTSSRRNQVQMNHRSSNHCPLPHREKFWHISHRRKNSTLDGGKQRTCKLTKEERKLWCQITILSQPSTNSSYKNFRKWPTQKRNQRVISMWSRKTKAWETPVPEGVRGTGGHRPVSWNNQLIRTFGNVDRIHKIVDRKRLHKIF